LRFDHIQFVETRRGAVIWVVVGRALRPIAVLTDAVAGSSPDSLRMIDGAPMSPELTPIVAALNSLLAHINRAMSMQRNFVTDAAHELRSPLAALKLELQIGYSARSRTARSG
jgi:two-component system OmpR family sensor kinase